MFALKLGALKIGGGRAVAALPAGSSQRAIDKHSEADLFGLAIEPPAAKAVEIPKPAESAAPEKIESFYSDGSRMERWKVWVSSLPLSFVLGLGFYLYFTGTPEWFAGVVMLAGFVVFALAGLLIEQQRLKAFACPRCQAPIDDWDTNEERRILFNCARCECAWDVEYKLGPSRAVRRKRFRRSHFSAICNPRGVH